MNDDQSKTKRYFLSVLFILNLYGLFGIIWMDVFKNQPFFGIVDLFVGANLLALIIGIISFFKFRDKAMLKGKWIILLNIVLSVVLLLLWLIPSVMFLQFG